MCGICGCTTEDTPLVEQMLNTITHRGPDDRGVHVANGVSLGHMRLAILDPSPNGKQPMLSKSGTTSIVFNGEIYNFKELIQTHNLQCTTGSDTEVLLLLYEKLGIRFVHELRGMFAFALHDTKEQKLYLVRDPHGMKPLYYTVQNSVLYFASETKAILQALPTKPAINTQALSLYFTHQYVPRPYTLLQDVDAVENGAVLEWQGSNLRTIDQITAYSPGKYANASSEQITQVLNESTVAHLISDKPVGLFLSGGLDSTILLHHIAATGVSNLQTFSVRFDVAASEQSAKFNTDADIAKRTAEYYGTEHNEVHITAEEFAAAYSSSAKYLDQPNANPTAPIQYLLAKAIKQKVDVSP